MTLLTCVFAAIICSILWYKHAPDNTMRLGTVTGTRMLILRRPRRS